MTHPEFASCSGTIRFTPPFAAVADAANDHDNIGDEVNIDDFIRCSIAQIACLACAQRSQILEFDRIGS